MPKPDASFPPDRTSPAMEELLFIWTYPVAAVTLPGASPPPAGQLPSLDASTESLLSITTEVFDQTFPQTVLLLCVEMSVRENSASLKAAGGARVTRRRRVARNAVAVPTEPVASIWYRFLDSAVTRYWYVPVPVEPVTTPVGTTAPEACSVAMASCTPDSATCSAWPHERLCAELVWSCDATYIIARAIMLVTMPTIRAVTIALPASVPVSVPVPVPVPVWRLTPPPRPSTGCCAG